MHLRSIVLRDWKAFRSARLDFPPPTSDRNVILIGGRNGFGKTSIFEAIVLGLFGRDGIGLINRAAAATDVVSRAQSFRDFIERALNGQALEEGRDNCRVELTFEDENGNPIIIDRHWYFASSGRLRQGENAESLRIFTGYERNVVKPPSIVSQTDDWYRDWIFHHFVPTNLANFFIFDGEAAAIYANRDMGEQVREGIEGLLGLNWLRRLQDDLRAYAAKRTSEVAKGADADAIAKLETEIATLEQEVREATATAARCTTEVQQLELERDQIVLEFGDAGMVTREQLQDLITEKKDREVEFQDANRRFFDLVEKDFPLALAASDIRDRLLARLAAEGLRESWLAGKRQGEARADVVIETARQRMMAMVPPLAADQIAAIEDAFRDALERLWNPAPAGAAEDFHHSHARGSMADRLTQRLEEAARITTSTVRELLTTMEAAGRALREVQTRIRSIETAPAQVEQRKARFQAILERLRALEQDRARALALLESRKPILEQRKKEQGRLISLRKTSAKPERLAKRAAQVSNMLGHLIGDALPLQAAEIAAAMTNAIHAMAHRSDLLHRIEIAEDLSVALMGPDGRDLRQYDLSAGEKQIFTQSLFAAVTQVSRRAFPLIVDTPLGRLDEQHRQNVLRHLAARSGQVILLSTDTEVVGPYLAAIRARILAAFRLANETHGNLGRSWPEIGYFPGQEM